MRNMTALTLMIQGTTSDAGKSLLVTAIGRWMGRQEIRVVPFKPQNMALNSAVTEDGGEIGRAQAAQALACGLEPHTDMNPVLLKPNSDTGAQVIIQGKSIGNMNALDYHEYKNTARAAVFDSHHRLEQKYDVVLVEGAGSPAEINLRENDIANMGFAEEADCPVILVADIDRGGVFAHLIGTLACLSESEQARIKGFVINRFRGDISLLQSGLDWLEEKTGKPVIGVLPYLHGLHLEAEDALNAKQVKQETAELFKVIVPVLPRISNHTDFDPLRLHPHVDLQYIRVNEPIPAADLIILPGSKNVRADLAFLIEQGWDKTIHKHLRYGGKLIGICGGYQMLGTLIDDPEGIEGPPGNSEGLGLLNLQTTLASRKQLKRESGKLLLNDAPIRGYEIHSGVTEGEALKHPAVELSYGPDGAVSQDGQIWGCYLHGLFESSRACSALLGWAGIGHHLHHQSYSSKQLSELDRLADTVEEHLDTSLLMNILKGEA